MKIMQSTLLAIVFLFLTEVYFCKAQPSESLSYRNSKLSADERAKNLLSRMTLEDKCAQLISINDDGSVFPDSLFSSPELSEKLLGLGLGTICPYDQLTAQETIILRNKIQHFLLEKTRLGIPAIFVDEGLHGLWAKGATSFPQVIGLSCSWDTALVREVYSVVASEMRSRGAQLALTPVVDITRDPRWGRTCETYGEDPYLSGILGSAAVHGFQGTTTGEISSGHVGSTLKHFAGHGQSEYGNNQAAASFPERTMREYHMLPFQICIEHAKPAAIMAAYVENDGVPCHMNPWLLKKVLRDEWNYNGLVVSDFWGIDKIWKQQYTAKDARGAAVLAFNAGVDIDLPQGLNYEFLPELVKAGKIKEALLDSSVMRILKFKFKLGLFENPYADAGKAIALCQLQSSKDLALKAAHESMVLLKNENDLLPLSKGKYKKIAVVGPCAKETFLGGYNGDPLYRLSILDGIRSKVSNSEEVVYAQGCKITTNFKGYYGERANNLIFPTQEENQKYISEAIEIAKSADIIILAIGEYEQISHEAFENSRGDAATLDLLSNQDILTKAMVSTGKPVVVYLCNGRPLSVNYQAENVAAIIEGWYLGQETGNAFADVLFGCVNPSGKLTITFPRSVGQLPMYYNFKPNTHIGYVTVDSTPLFPFGFGMSYTSFTYGKPRISEHKILPEGTAIFSVDVTNSGKLKGDEIVQLYIHDKISSVTRPEKELKGFQRISLEPGQTQTVQFTIDKSKLAFWDINMKYTVEPGDFDLMVGSSSVDLQTVLLTVD